MVCTTCAAKKPPTNLATPAVRRKSELYHGSSASSSGKKPSATLGNAGITKSKLLTAAKNPYAAAAAAPKTAVCKDCKGRVEAGNKYCQRCAYKANGGFGVRFGREEC